MLPDGWTKETIGERVEVKHGFAFASSHFNSSGEGYRLLTPGHFREEGGFREIGDKQKFFSGAVPNGYLLKQGDLLVVMTEQAPGLLGSSVLIPEDDVYLHNQRLGLVRILDPVSTSRDFLFHLFNAEYVRKHVSDAAGGTKVRHSSPDKLRSVPALFPPKLEQDKIGTILNAWDCAIRQLSDLIAAKLGFMQGLMQQLLTGQRRFKGHRDEWHAVQLREVTTECDERNRGRLGVEAVKAVTKAEGIVPMRERTIGADIARYQIVKKNWFAYNPMRINIGSIARWSGDNEILVSPDYVVFRCKDTNGLKPTLNPDYLDHLRRSGIWEKFVTSSGNGSVRIRIYFSDLGHLKFTLPILPEQRKIASFLNTAVHEIELLRKKLKALRQQKQGLMQKLLTGQIRVEGWK